MTCEKKFKVGDLVRIPCSSAHKGVIHSCCPEGSRYEYVVLRMDGDLQSFYGTELVKTKDQDDM